MLNRANVKILGVKIAENIHNNSYYEYLDKISQSKIMGINKNLHIPWVFMERRVFELALNCNFVNFTEGDFIRTEFINFCAITV